MKIVFVLQSLFISSLSQSAFSFSLPSSTSPSTSSTKCTSKNDVIADNESSTSTSIKHSRRDVMKQAIHATTSAFILGGLVNDAQALVEGSKPPSKTKALPEEYLQGTLTLSEMDSQAPIPREAYNKLPSGVIYADLRVGGGDIVASEGSKVNLQWVLRKSNGYFVDSSAVQNDVPFIFTIGDKSGTSASAIEGIDEAVRGMRAGGTRRILIPPSLAYVKGLEDNLPGPMPAGFGPRQQMRRVQGVRKDVPGEYIFLEVQCTRIR